MSWSLQIRNGDFTLSGSQFGTVSNEAKLTQDLRCAILEKMGTDSLHPEYGSLIDGGRRPDGLEIPGVIGESRIDLVVLAIESEIRRIARDHQAKQLSRAKSDRLTYSKSTISPAEALLAISNISVQQIQDTLDIQVVLQTAKSEEIEIGISLPNTTI